jgi:hypothetical protein
MLKLRIRPWVMGLFCLISGLVSHIVLAVYATPGSKVEAVEQSCIQLFWFGLGLSLTLVDLCRVACQKDCKVGWLWIGVFFWVMALIGACAGMIRTMPP